jgi:D-mannonate dehydratase
MARRYKRNVKKWNKNTNHIERTLVLTLKEAESRFRRVRGYRELAALKEKIQNFEPPLATLMLRDRIIKDEIKMRTQSHDRHISNTKETVPLSNLPLVHLPS